MALNTISYNGKVYSDQDIKKATAYRKSVVVDDALPYDTFEVEVWDNDDKMTDFTYGDPVVWTHRGKVVLKQFLESVKRTGKYKYMLSCVSGIGIIAKIRHYGGLYSNASFSSVLADIVGGAFPYTVDSNVASIAVYGWLPVDSRRNNLRKLLTSCGVLIKANSDGSIRFSSPDGTSPTHLADQNIFMGGSVDYPTKYQSVKITEHAYAKTPNDILTTLLDGEASGTDIITPAGVAMNGALITFNDPMHDLSVAGSTILESGVNYAVLSPSTSCTLTGYKYSHTTRIVTAGALTAAEQVTKRLDDCTLVNVFNADAVAQRWIEYFSAQKVVQVSAVWNGEQPGNALMLSDPYDEQAVGIIESQDVRLSAKLVEDTTIQAGKIPTSSGNYYSNVAVIQSSGTWTVPEDCKGKIRVVCIGGGDGGQIGNAGSDGGKSSSAAYGQPGEGGSSGAPGNGGKILVETMAVSVGQTLTISIGIGGKGQSATDPATPGGATTVDQISSENGHASQSGYIDLINKVAYGIPGIQGIKGGRGTGGPGGNLVPGDSITYNGVTSTPGADGATNTSHAGKAFGGCGGGAAVGMNGGNGKDGTAPSNGDFIIGESGGSGATPVKADKGTIPGQGGQGGHGGGGGGCGGPAIPKSSYHAYFNPGGNGGEGGEGGDGADGIVLIYY